MSTPQKIKFAFFGSSHLSIIVLDEMEKAGVVPSCIVTTPDKPQGRKLILTPNVVKDWATKRNITVYDWGNLKKTDDKGLTPADQLKKENCEIFIVASYGKIIPTEIVNMAPKKMLNIHPSLLPIYRGPSPLPTAILNDTKHTGITIMRVDEMMDHGPIVAVKEIEIKEWPTYEEFEEFMAREGAQLLIDILPDWIAGNIKEIDQDDSKATYTKKIIKEDGLVNLGDDPYLNFRKIQAYHEWPQAYFILNHKGDDLRIKITQASFKSGKLLIEKVIPEGGKEMNYGDFIRGYGIQTQR